MRWLLSLNNILTAFSLTSQPHSGATVFFIYFWRGDLLQALRTGHAKHTGLHFKRESKLHRNFSGRELNPESVTVDDLWPWFTMWIMIFFLNCLKSVLLHSALAAIYWGVMWICFRLTYVWIGGTEQAITGTYRWTNGKAMDWLPWTPEQPNDETGVRRS